MERVRGGLFLAVAAGALLLGTAATTWAAFPGANGRIAYSGNYGRAHSNIFTILTQGSETQQLTDDRLNDVQPSWSASGHRIAYVSPSYYHGEVFTIGAHGGKETQVTHDHGVLRSPHFSPNGRRIVYQRSWAGNGSIFTIDTDGTDRRRVVTGGVWPSYSPSGTRIVFSGTPGGEDDGGIWTVHPDGSHLRRVTRNREKQYYDQMPEWAPDGRHILFVRCDFYSAHECDGDLELMRADGSHKRRIASWTGDYSSPSFSPDGKRIALVSKESQGYDADFCADIYTVNLSDSDRQLITQNCEDYDKGGPRVFAEQPTWQPLPMR